MPENCGTGSCSGLETLTDRVDRIEKLNGENHRQMREDIHTLEIEHAKQEGQLSMIISTLTEMKGDTKTVLEKMNDVAARASKIDDLEEAVEEVKGDVDVIKSKPGQTWEDIKKDSLKWVIALIMAIVAVALGLERFL